VAVSGHQDHTLHAFATSTAGAAWWLVEQAYQHGPSWSLVPPILFGVASVVGAANAAINDRHKRRLDAAARR
jgi:asparagine N-glycosylation enzyme membrane subunit Stt3